MQQKQQQPKQQAGQHQPGQQGNPQPGKHGQPGSNPGRNEEFPGKAPDIYDKNRDRSETPDAARKQGSRNDPPRRQ